MSFLRALRAYIGLGPDEDIEDRYLYELNSRRRELDLDEIEAEEISLDRDHAEGDFEIESDDVIIVTPGGGRTNVPQNGSSGYQRPTRSEIRSSHSTSRSGQRSESNRDRRSSSSLDRDGGASRGSGRRSDPLDDLNFDRREGGATADRDGVFSDGRGGGRIGTSNSQLDADGILDFLEDETFIGDQPGEPVGPSGEPRGRSAAEGRRERATGSRSAGPADPPADSVVRSLDSMRAKPRTLIPESFADAKLVADEFKRDIPVLLNLQGLERDLARRLIDFASGICYAMDGSMEKIASQVFLLIPESVQVSDEDRRRIEERGYAR